jgi:hypothetical protein
MADLPSYDQDLLKRLNALKKTSITLDTDEYVGLPQFPAMRLKSVQPELVYPQDTFNSRNRLGIQVTFLA